VKLALVTGVSPIRLSRCEGNYFILLCDFSDKIDLVACHADGAVFAQRT
jgi:hypothetical protein